MIRRALDWLHARSGYRTGLSRLLYEPLPPGTGWWFTLGSVLLFLLTVELLTGAFLTLYYAPTPDHAYESVRFIAREATLGWLVRGLHFFGASFIVVFASLHLLRVVVLGSYKAPRELTWLSGVTLLLAILASALTGYLLPWDQRAYWATIVTINIARAVPLVGEAAAAVMRGGEDIGALTLSRWFAMHVIFLPAVLVCLVMLHVYLMRRHGISGPVRPRPGRPFPFYPFQAARDLAVVALVAASLLTFALVGPPGLEAKADPTDASYVPRPEWYFLALFELLKYFPGRLELIATVLVPGLAVALILLLPWLDRRAEREPRRRSLVIGGAAAATLALAMLTALGLRDRPRSTGPKPNEWRLREIAGQVWLVNEGCTRCHTGGGVADTLDNQPISLSPVWLTSHIADPEVIAPGVREAPLVNEREVEAIVAYVRRLSRGDQLASPPDGVRAAALVFARYCIGCHTIDRDGGTEGPDLSAIGRKHDRQWLRRWITNPRAIDPDTEMPAFGRRLNAQDIDAIAGYLADRR